MNKKIPIKKSVFCLFLLVNQAQFFVLFTKNTILTIRI